MHHSALETYMRYTAFKCCFQLHLAPLLRGTSTSTGASRECEVLDTRAAGGRGLHSSTSELNLSRFGH